MSPASYKVLDATTRAQLHSSEHAFALDILEGLSEVPKRISSKYLYDQRGSELFAQLMTSEDYYPTDCEFEILRNRGKDIAEGLAGKRVNIIDLGAGNGEKTLVLLQQMQQVGVDIRYVPIDISEQALQAVTKKIATTMPELDVAGLVAEYEDAMRWIRKEQDGRVNFVLFLGSNLGNFTKVQARRFLRQLWNLLNPNDLLFTGFDLKKDIEVLLRAYNDSEGITRDFNLNLLTRINRELGGTFDTNNFRHYGTYDVLQGGMKSYLVSLNAQSVYVDALQHSFTFQAWEPISTEYSYKYLDGDIGDLAEATGFEVCERYYDSRRYFVDSLWRVCARAPATLT